jgi:hypothetical protein
VVASGEEAFKVASIEVLSAPDFTLASSDRCVYQESHLTWRKGINGTLPITPSERTDDGSLQAKRLT